MRKLYFISLFVFIALASAPAFAARQCYSPAELNAEQTLRLHSELMVITVTCKQGSRAQDLVSAYTGFTRNNIEMLRQAEQTMIHYYQNIEGSDGIASLDTLRTRLGNEYGQQIADVSAPIFCQRLRDLVLNDYKLNPTQVADQVQHMIMTAQPYGHLCTYAANTATKPDPAPKAVAGLGIGTSSNYIASNAADLLAKN